MKWREMEGETEGTGREGRRERKEQKDWEKKCKV